MKVFLAGIMQGSHTAAVLHDQDYRRRLQRLLQEHLPEVELYDPLAENQDSLEYDDELGRQTFYRHNRMCAEVDLLLAFVPEATMGTAIEMWEAHRHGRIVLTVSPLKRNWTVRFLSDHVFPDIESLAALITAGKLPELIHEIRRRRQ